MAHNTRERIVDASAELFRRQGYVGTGLKQIVAAAGAPFGSLYHFFPGGKEELGAEVIRVAGDYYRDVVTSAWTSAGGLDDPVAGVRAVFLGAAQTLIDTDYADACPIATVSLEVASTNDTLRAACEHVYDDWLDGWAAGLTIVGIDPHRAREIGVLLLSLLEGAFVLCRTMRTTEALEVAADAAARIVEDALPKPRRRRKAGSP